MLILDGHDSHNFVEIIELAIENQISLVELPAHMSHWLQPCDRTIFGPLKAHYNTACTDMMNLFPCIVVSHTKFCTLFNTAWIKAMTPNNIQSGFRACGIYPFNPSEIPATAYLPNCVYSVAHLMANRELLSTTADNLLPVARKVVVETADRDANIADPTGEAISDMGADMLCNLNDYMSSDAAVVAAIKQKISPQEALDLLQLSLKIQTIISGHH